MNQSKIAVRYAKAFFLLAQEKDQLEAYRKDMDSVNTVFQQDEMKSVALSPVLKTSKKKAAIQEIFKDKISAETLNFLQVIADNKREAYILDICRNFSDQYRSFKGIKAAKVITAQEVDQTLQNKISQVIASVFKTEVELTTETNPALKGGFVLRVGDQQIDASVATKLSNIKRTFLEKTV